MPTHSNENIRKIITSQYPNDSLHLFLATGDSYQTIAFSYRVSHLTVQSICLEVCKAINEILLAEYIPTPCKEKWLEIANEMWTTWNFPNCLGALDGKHVTIQAPANSGSLYFNYKKSFSIVLLALLDVNYKFTAVDIGSYGKSLQNCKLNVPEDSPLSGTDTIAPYVILGDEAFPLKKYLVRPNLGSKSIEDIEKRIFNYRLYRGRRSVECVFGILSQTFRVYCRKIIADPEKATTIILTTCILHNIIRNNRS
uniref:uncharacterized protein LOC117609903 n=1 Tax=Osmia lignaria TaxID=473952 RepID=UPI00147925DB|nr:uncharacterized protein LOC117609903 [Osmia lignaria]